MVIQNIPVFSTKREAVIYGLRALADFYESHPDFPAETYEVRIYNYPTDYNATAEEKHHEMVQRLADHARMMKPADKYSNTYDYGLKKVLAKYDPYGDADYQYDAVVINSSFDHESVCELVETGEEEEVIEYAPTPEELEAISAAQKAYNALMQAAKRPVKKAKTEWVCPQVLPNNQ